jgi:hypothetical protein
MPSWGWALLTTRPRLVEWHKVVQDVERLFWARDLTGCRLRIEAPEVEPEERPGDGPFCSACRETSD